MKTKYCKYCGKELMKKQFACGKTESNYAILKRQYCNRKCMGLDHTIDNPRAGSIYSRLERKNIRKKERCEKCGAIKDLCYHHKDENVFNNSIDNIMVICRGCHVKIHNELGSYNHPGKQNLDLCLICGNPTMSLNLCHVHYHRYNKYGNPFLVGIINENGRTRFDFDNIPSFVRQWEIIGEIKEIQKTRINAKY